ncbi:uncharacterized protein PGTG_08802 [Puccinia graminis f. sp. tritici CRL 75-36-700-3]|uniref:Skg3/CAF120-like PH-like domain-containing protein n=1 Tax=Puccinia graminis f. sp. tritici (strain CRL 75-36-700-3 / race SCCL) TaxID=418459 RepID=E3KE64_PUCGT|nr:uncharacterized protein PGTG_08802 [Puccinia graminis f. sp. tritici CRL 75-36-700-3]EFP82606.1 hypothetical protein PGTG_08802 [Puccinia graminis f. sp. tritici CRL 75-36-700-3]
MSQPTGTGLTPTHDLERLIDLFRLPKFYYEGFIFRRTILLSDGAPPKRTDQNALWAKYYVQIAGTTMSCWDAAEIEMAAQEGRQVAPTYTNITDARVDLPDPHSSAHSTELLNPPSPHLFFLNNAGRNKFGFACLDQHSLLAWVSAIRLSSWERSRLFEIYTGTLLGLRFFNHLDSPTPNEKAEGYLTIRFPKDTEWTKVWAVLVRDKALLNGTAPQNYYLKDNKWNRRGSLFNLAGLVNKTQHSPSSSTTLIDPDATRTEPGLVFYPKKGAKKHIGILTNISFAAAVYPESRALIESSTMFKLEGRFEGIMASHDGRPSESQTASVDQEGFILATPDEGTECDMLGWLLGVMSAFRLYGKPAKFNYDPTDPNSFYFAYPIGPERERLFLDCQTVAESLDVQEHSLAQLRQKFTSLVAARLHLPRKSVADLPESVHEPYEPIVTTPQSIDEPLSYLSAQSPSSQPALKSLDHSSTPRSPPSVTLQPSPASESPASDPNSSYSDPPLTSEIPENALRPPTSEPPSSDHHSRSPVTPQSQSELLEVGKPARPLSTLDDDLVSFAAYVTYEDPVDTPEVPTSLLISSPSPASSPSKSPSATLAPITEKTHQSSSDNPPDPVSPSRQAASQSAANDPIPEGYEDMIYALSLVDQESPMVPPPQEDSIGPSKSAQAPSTRSDSPQLEFLSRPPPASVSPQPNSAPISPDAQAVKPSFPSSFAAGKKGAARLAAAQAAQAAGKASGFRPGKPGRTASAGQKKPPSSWNSSDSEDDDDDENPNDDDDEEDEDEEGEEDDRLKKHRLTTAMPSSISQVNSERGFQANQERKTMLLPQATTREGTYSMYSTGGPTSDSRPISQAVSSAGGSGGGAGGEMGQFPNPANRREVPAVLRDQPAETGAENNGLRPAFSQHGLLHRVMQERQEKSAKSIQEAAHWSGEPLVQVNHKPPPIQSGLLGAIASHERDRKRDGGMGAMLTERARERALRQRETDELQRQSMFMMAGAGPMGFPNQPGFNQLPMLQMMYNHQPHLFPTAAGMPTPYEQMMFQQHQFQLQQQAILNAQQYMVGAPYPYSAAPLLQQQQQQQQSLANGANPSGTLSTHQSVYGFPLNIQQQQQQQQAQFGFLPLPSQQQQQPLTLNPHLNPQHQASLNNHHPGPVVGRPASAAAPAPLLPGSSSATTLASAAAAAGNPSSNGPNHLYSYHQS